MRDQRIIIQLLIVLVPITGAIAVVGGADINITIGICGMVILLIIGLWIFLNGFMDILFGFWSRTWQGTDGEIIKSKLSASHKKITFFWPTVSYRYEVAGKSLNGSRIAYAKFGTMWNPTSSERIAIEILHKYPEGAVVTVYYHHRFNKLSVLEPGFQWGSVGNALLGFVLTSVASYFLYRIIVSL